MAQKDSQKNKELVRYFQVFFQFLQVFGKNHRIGGWQRYSRKNLFVMYDDDSSYIC